ncbi:EAL domain-containing protein [Undibacterium sp. LX40W]|uniref:EAL domain-containing protein n=1 Tax=Undibacterium nitidum TaxID=2762298 RepID=A0A923KTV7_9BURK|nr:GGDEF domain-containing phosphodiesterase [Undibacterium nitidum]MBC3881627.1 EAL domain-containing protein [Undibacterium nitidum]MBC3891590.1 EAL domain-containing protein [Undibacterium sp. LX40W]
MRIRHLQTRIIIAFSALLLIVQVVSLVFVNSFISKSANKDIEHNLLSGEKIFNSIRADNTKWLTQSAGILTSDFAFVKAVATGDRNTIVSVLQNHGGRINADIAMLVGTDNTLVADTLKQSRAGQAFAFPQLIKLAEQNGQTSSVVMFDGKLYQLVVVPVMAPLPVAWLALGFVIDDKFAANLKSLTGLEVSFMAPNAVGGKLQLLASTLPTDSAATLPRDIALVAGDIDAYVKVTSLANEDYLTRISRLKLSADIEAVTVLQQSLDIVLAPLRRLQMILILLGVLALGATLAASFRIARNITRPLRDLSTVTEDIERGNYKQSKVLAPDDEIGQLASAIHNMAQGIAVREERISELAYRDGLTGLANRTAFSQTLDQTIDDAQRRVGNAHAFSVLLMDIDRFKDVNDILGHHIGDMLLKEIVQRLQHEVSTEFNLIARLGGDEFGMLLCGQEPGRAIGLAAQIREALDRPILLEGHQVIASGSIGVVHYPLHGNQQNALLRHAELAMYTAKRSNSGYVVYDPALKAHTQQNLSLLAELRHAIEHDELKLYYQPKVKLKDNTISEVEALIRWIHPKRGVIPPDQFIPFAESTGFIGIITEWVIQQALHQRRAWQEKALPLTISINISARDLLNPKLPSVFSELMNRYQAEPHWLSLEITESAIMTDPKSALEVLNQLRIKGLRMSIDDFGTGYSSLAYLKKLPVNELKIDKSFITDMENNPDDAVIVRSTIDLGHNMGLTVIAEGVENQATWDALAHMGCDAIQGYFVSRPLAAETLENWLQTSHWKFKEDHHA